MSGGGKSQTVTVGYKYYLGVQVVINTGPVDEVSELVVGERSAWTGSITTNGSVSVNAPDLFGGDSREGGVAGTMTVTMGDTATQDSYLVAKIGSHVPAYIGLTTVIFKSFLWSSINPYFKAPWLRFRRILSGWSRGIVWYSSKARIGSYDMNPAHIIYQCITDIKWGMGYSPVDVDDTTFMAAADKLYTEGFGLSLIWDQQMEINDFIQIILNHINGTLSLDLATGKYILKLIRDDYDINTVLELNPTNILEMGSFQRAGFGELGNSITVKYTDRDQNEQTVTTQDLAAIDAQGGTEIPVTKEYLGIRDASLAMRVAMRDLNTSASPLAKISITTNRVTWDKAIGDVFAFTWPKLGITKAAFRIVSIDKGSLVDGKISIEAVEDVFGLPTSVYTASQPNAWSDPIQPPAPVINQLAIEAPYWDVVRNLATSDMANLTTGYGFGEVIAASPVQVNYGFELWEGPTTAVYEYANRGHFAPTGTLATDIGYTTATVALNNAQDLSGVNPGTYAVLDGEYVSVVSVNTSTNTVVLGRGVLDTVPIKHSAGARIFFAEANLAYDPTEYVSGVTEHYKALTKTPLGVLSLGSATDMPLTFANRASLPYPPGNLKINTVSYPDSISGALSLTWAHRDRTAQTVSLTPYSVGNIGPETNVSYTLNVIGESSTFISASNLTNTSYSTPLDTEATASGVNDTGTTRDIRQLGIAAVSSAVSTALNSGHYYGPVYDPAYTASLLLHMDGTNTSTTFTDSSSLANTITVGGNAQISTAQSVFGGSSAVFDGNGDYLRATNAQFAFGTGDFTIEFWARRAGDPSGGSGTSSVLLDFRTAEPSVQIGIDIDASANGAAFRYYVNGSFRITGGSATLNTWFHVALCRSSGTTRMFINGTQVGGAVSDTNNFTGTMWTLGSRFDLTTSRTLNGYIDEFRIVSGAALYTSNFTTPSSALSASFSSTGKAGWLGAIIPSFPIGTQEARHISNSATVTTRSFAAGWSTSVQGFSLKSGVYQSSVSPDSYIGYGVSILDPLGIDQVSALNEYDSVVNSFLNGTPITDRRSNADYVLYICARKSNLVWFPQSRSANRRLYHTDFGIRRISVDDVLTGPINVTRQGIDSFYSGDVAQFNDFTNQYLHAPTYSGYFNSGGAAGSYNELSARGIIFGSVLYYNYIGGGTTTNTAGKTVTMTNILTADIDVSATLQDKTKVFTVDSLGNLTLVSTRNGIMLADQMTATLGVEISGTSFYSINMTTGAQISFVGSIPATALAICGDPPNNCFYVYCVNNMLYKYSSTGTQQASIGPFTGLTFYPGDAISVSANKVYLKSFYECPKDLSTYRYSSGLAAIYSAKADSTIMYGNFSISGTPTNTLLDDSGIGTAVLNGATPRPNDTITVQLKSVRNGLNSYTQHNVTVKRQGMGLRMGESMGG